MQQQVPHNTVPASMASRVRTALSPPLTAPSAALSLWNPVWSADQNQAAKTLTAQPAPAAVAATAVAAAVTVTKTAAAAETKKKIQKKKKGRIWE